MRHAVNKVLSEVLVLASLLVLPATVTTAIAPGNMESLARAPQQLRDFLAGTVTLEAAFSQVLLESDSARTQVSTGRFFLHRPQRFRWNYETPVPHQVVADGENLWLYDPDLEQVTVRRLDDGLSSTPALLLSGTGSLDESFYFGAAYHEDGFDWVELRPAAEGPDFVGVRVGFVEDRLAAMELIDALGQTTVIWFTDITVNEPLDPALFQFVPPPGADVIHDEGF